MFDKSKIIALVKQKGPVLPVQITKEMNTSPMFAGAMLSELVDNKQLRLSNTKIGSSPVYYLEGQEDKLPALLYNYLHEKEKKAYDILKSRGIIRDSQEEPVVRVALRAIKDFAVPFEVKKGNEIEIFWKYFLINDTDAEKMIREILAFESPAKQEEKKTSKNQKKWKNHPRKKQSKKNRTSKTKPKQKTQKNAKQSQFTSKTSRKNLIKKQSKTSSNKKIKKKKASSKKINNKQDIKNSQKAKPKSKRKTIKLKSSSAKKKIKKLKNMILKSQKSRLTK